MRVAQRFAFSCFLPLLTFSSQAIGVVPSDDVHIGIEPARVYSYTPEQQQQLASTGLWQEFLQDLDAQWYGRFDEQTGYLRRAWGEGIPMSSLQDGTALASEVLQSIEGHERLMGYDDHQLQLRTANYVQRVDTWYLEWDLLIDNIPVYRGGLSARVKHGNLISLGFNTYGDQALKGQPELNAVHAIHIAKALGPAPTADHTALNASLQWLPVEVSDHVDLKLTWKVESETAQPVGKWISFIDAHTGALLNVHNEVRFLTGTISGDHHQRNPGSSIVNSVLPDQWVYNDSKETYTDLNGLFELSGGESSYTAELRGKYLRVFNDDGADGRLRFTEGSPVWTTDSATQAEIDSYTFLHQIRAWGQRVAPEVRMSTESLRSYVNKTDGSCNAYYNGDVNFYAKEGSCNNTGQIADVNYHEWGHGFHYYSAAGGGGTIDGSVGEGVSDVISILQTRDPVMARYFYTNGSGIRTANNDKRYPDDLRGEVHADGTILSAAYWDLIRIFNEEMSEEESYELASSLLAGMLKGGPALDNSWDEIVIADDDDGDLSNGTPHYCQILDAFGLHGLGPGAALGTVFIAHEPLDFVNAGGDHSVDASVGYLAEGCGDFDPSDATVTYRVNGSGWSKDGLALTSDTISGSIPQQEFGAFVEYYISLNSGDETMSSPIGAYINPHSFYVGDVLEITCSDFEDSDGGFTHSLLSGEETEGADDWQWGSPRGEGGDPSEAWSGSRIWGNDLGADNYNGEYQNDKHNRLLSPEYDIFPYEGVFLQYRRWLQVEDGFYDHSQILANDAVVWDNYDSDNEDGGYHHKDYQWASHVVDLQLDPEEETVQIGWDIISDGGLTLGGWNIDDVCIFAPATPNNRLAITDFQAGDEEDGGITLTWTHPVHAPVKKVVVIRKEAEYPQGPTDGAVVFELANPDLGTPVAFTDTEVNGNKLYYYAVYAQDGSDWLGWTIEGRNADTGSAVGLPADNDIIMEQGGCACTSTPHPMVSLWWLMGGVVLWGMRRRMVPEC